MADYSGYGKITEMTKNKFNNRIGIEFENHIKIHLLAICDCDKTNCTHCRFVVKKGIANIRNKKLTDIQIIDTIWEHDFDKCPLDSTNPMHRIKKYRIELHSTNIVTNFMMIANQNDGNYCKFDIKLLN